MPSNLKEMRARYKTLPDDVQDAVISINVEEVLEEIQKQYSLHVDQASELADETYLLMHGITHPAQFVGNIANRCRISPETARKIGGKSTKRFFAPSARRL
ncbi:MAG: hypothetical protein ACRESZ_19825 [Methylococcales bacterium]